jgi:hypothetical protein
MMKHAVRYATLFDHRLPSNRNPMKRRESNLLQPLVVVAAITMSLAFLVGIARAQDSSVPMPDTGGFGMSDPSQAQDPGGDGYSSPDDVTMPSTDMGAPQDSVSIPIPGGGQVSVDGPDAPDDSGISTNPGNNWGEQVQAPASQGVGPMGP